LVPLHPAPPRCDAVLDLSVSRGAASASATRAETKSQKLKVCVVAASFRLSKPIVDSLRNSAARLYQNAASDVFS
jgi:hypothetical protein